MNEQNLAILKYLKPAFDARCEECIRLITEYNFDYEEVGVFGSYARGDYNARSDIDFCMIIPNHPDRSKSGSLRQDLEDLGADLVYMTRKDFLESNSRFNTKVRKEYIRVI